MTSKNIRAKLGLLMLTFVALSAQSSLFAQGTAFAYQGRLNARAIPATGSYDLRFAIYSSSTGGVPVAGPLANSATSVSNGIFSALLDFGTGVFTGPDRWLEIAVRTNGGNAFAALTPRQPVTPSPYAIFALSSGSAPLPSNVARLDAAQTFTAAQNFQGQVTLDGNIHTAPGRTLISTGRFHIQAGEHLYLNPHEPGGDVYVGGGSRNAKLFVTGDILADGDIYTNPGKTIFSKGLLRLQSLLGEPLFLNSDLNSGEVVVGGNGSVALQVTGELKLKGSETQGSRISTTHGLNFNVAGGPLIFNENINGSANELMRIAGGDASVLQWSARGLQSSIFLASPAYPHYGGPGSLNVINFQQAPIVFGQYINSTPSELMRISQVGDATVLRLDAAGPQASILLAGPTHPNWGGPNSLNFINHADAPIVFGHYINSTPYASTRITRTGLQTQVLTITGGADIAEPFRMSTEGIPEGSVVIIDEENPGQLKLSDHAYDKRVAGIVSGANGIQPGISLSQQGAFEGGQNMALSGRVYALADASTDPIKPGDLLTTSDTPGHCMRVTDHSTAQGAIIGKAMGGLNKGRGMVLVLVTLQ